MHNASSSSLIKKHSNSNSQIHGNGGGDSGLKEGDSGI